MSFGVCSDSQIRAQRKYDDQHAVHISLKLNTGTDKEIIRWLHAQKSMQGAIKQLIRKEIEEKENK